MPKQPSIFVNYRTALSQMEARMLYLMLESRFPGEVFQDEETLKAGDVWRPKIENAIGQAKVMLVLITSEWVYHPGDKGYIESHPDKLSKLSQLHFDEDCNVRKEIEAALQKGEVELTIIPVLINGAIMPRKDQLPDSIQPLFKIFNAANKRRSLDFRNPNVSEFEKLFDQIAEKAGLTQKTGNDNVFQPPLDREFPLPDELEKVPPKASSPFVGLKPFSREDARLFFGRSREIYSLCYRIIHHQLRRIFLLDGYSGTGKSSLLQAGIIPRIEAQGWAVAYGRREEDKIKGLSGVFERLMEELENEGNAGKPNKLLILDQIEEVLTNPIDIEKNELEKFIGNLDIARRQKPQCKFMLGFRSEYTAHLLHALKNYIKEEEVIQINTLYPLDRNGVIEAISGVNRHKDLKKKFKMDFSPVDVPEIIADRLINSRIGYHIAPLLQVNMEVLWQKCRQKNGEVKIFKGNVRDLIDSREKLLDHYLEKIRERIPREVVDDPDLEILEILNFYTELEPVSAIRRKEEFLKKKFRTKDRSILWAEIKKQHLVTSLGEGENDITRLSHDVLAKVISQKYKELEERNRELKEKELEESKIRQFELLLEKFREQLNQLKYLEAQRSLDELMGLRIRREVLKPYLFELLFFWNEVERKESVLETIQFLLDLDSNLLSESAKYQAEGIKRHLRKEAIRQWVQNLMTQNDFEDLQNRYFSPPGTCMVKVPGGTFHREKAGEVKVDSFRIANIQTTFRKYGLYLYAIGDEKRLDEMAPNWGIQADHPVINVNWYDAIEYCNWLSEVKGLEEVYTIDKTQKDPNNQNERDTIKWLVTANLKADGYRLPTEAEWEFAARGGKESKEFEFSGSDNLDDVGWYDKNSDNKSHPVAQKQPNELGLYDMSGNVWEWCWDWYGEYPSEPQENPYGPEKGEDRVLRGGSWGNFDNHCRVGYRYYFIPDFRSNDYGFRLTQGLPSAL